MNIAYVILAHKRPNQIIRLVRRLNGPGASFAIHVDLAHRPVFRQVNAALGGMPNVAFAERVPVTWGAYSITRGIFNGIRALCEADFDFDYAALLSGQDYPLQPNEAIRAWLKAHRGQELIETRPFPREDWAPDGGYDRVERHHLYLPGGGRLSYPTYEDTGIKWFINRLLSLFLSARREFPVDYDPYGGSTWWCLSRRAVEYVRIFMESQRGRRLLSFFKTAQLADEILIHTILGNSRFEDRVADTYPWFIDWSENRNSPPVLTLDRFDELAASGKLFARKFDAHVDSAILDRIDRELLGYEGG